MKLIKFISGTIGEIIARLISLVALLFILVGAILSFTVIGMIIGIPLIIFGAFLLVIAGIITGRRFVIKKNYRPQSQSNNYHQTQNSTTQNSNSQIHNDKIIDAKYKVE